MKEIELIKMQRSIKELVQAVNILTYRLQNVEKIYVGLSNLLPEMPGYDDAIAKVAENMQKFKEEQKNKVLEEAPKFEDPDAL